MPLPHIHRNNSTLVIDLMARVHTVGRPKNGTTFGDVADEVVKSILHSGRYFHRIEVVGDRYRQNSIKATTRSKRSKGLQIRKSVDDRNVPLPSSKKDYSSFLSLDDNKADIQRFLGEQLIVNAPADKIIVVAGAFQDEEEVQCSQQAVDVQNLICNHEEADTRIILHTAQSTSTCIVISACDTDIFVLLLAHNQSFNGKSVYVMIGNNMYLSIADMAQALGQPICDSVLLFHSLTGCDTTSFFFNIGKPTALNVLKEHTHLLAGLSKLPQLTAGAEKALQNFVSLVYSGGDEGVDRIQARMLLTAPKPELMPPTSDALKFHLQRAFYQARVWECATESHPALPDPTAEGSGWFKMGERVKPVTMLKEPIPKACMDIISCGSCTTGCNSQRCKCFKAGLHCTLLCHRKLPPGVCKNSSV